jgi:hypothetical protein
MSSFHSAFGPSAKITYVTADDAGIPHKFVVRGVPRSWNAADVAALALAGDTSVRKPVTIDGELVASSHKDSGPHVSTALADHLKGFVRPLANKGKGKVDAPMLAAG